MTRSAGKNVSTAMEEHWRGVRGSPCLGLVWGRQKRSVRGVRGATAQGYAAGDYGGSRLHSALRTKCGQVIGTPGFMAPELALGRMSEADERSGVYGLGALLYQVLVGRSPFTGKSVQELQKVVDDEP